MCVGKKAAGKKNKFWVGRFSFIQFALEENLIFVTALGALHITVWVLPKAGISKTKSSIKPELSKNHFRFFKITKNKKTKWFFVAKNADTFYYSFTPALHKTHVELNLR